MAGKGQSKSTKDSARKNKGRPVPVPSEMLERAGLRPGSRVVDFGCGAGGDYALAAAEMVGSGGKVVSVAPDAETLASIMDGKTPEWLEVVESVDLVPEAGQGSFDFGVMAYTFHAVKGVAKFLTEVNQVLTHGARLLVVDWRKVEDGFQPPKKSRLARGDAQALLERAGFYVEEAEFLDSSNYLVLAVKDEHVEKVNLYGER